MGRARDEIQTAGYARRRRLYATADVGSIPTVSTGRVSRDVGGGRLVATGTDPDGPTLRLINEEEA